MAVAPAPLTTGFVPTFGVGLKGTTLFGLTDVGEIAGLVGPLMPE